MIVNPFGIPEMVEQATGDLDLDYVDEVPLRPWRLRGHDRMRLAVDQTDDAFRDFLAQVDDVNDLASGGRLVVVDGIEGSGKTTLIHRCVDDLRTRLAGVLGHTLVEPDGDWEIRPPVPGVFIVDLSEYISSIAYDNKGQFRSLEEINRKIFNRVVREVRNLVEGPTTALKSLADDTSGDLADLYQELSELLRRGRQFVMVVLPFINLGPWQLHIDFLRAHLSFCGRRIVFFAETTESDVMKGLRPLSQHERRRVAHLSVGPLKTDDWKMFVEERMARPDLPPKHVTMASEALAGVPADVQYGTVRVLQNSFFELGEIVRRAGRTVICADDWETRETAALTNPILVRNPAST